MYLRHGFRRPNFVPKFGASVMGIGPYGETGKASATTRASGAQRSVCAAVARDGQESRQRSSPKRPSTPDNPSVSLRLPAPFTQGSLGDGGCGLPRRPCGPPRNDNRFLSFRGAERRGNPSFLRWTMDGGSGRPTKDEGRHAGSSCPTGGCGEPPRLPWVAAHSGAFAPAGARKRVGIAAEFIPKAFINLGQSLSHDEAVTAPFTQGSLRDGGCGLP